MTGPAIALVALVILVWSLVLLAGTLGTIDLTGEDGADSDGEAVGAYSPSRRSWWL